jgi:uncharacterized protein (DUF1501 family)
MEINRRVFLKSTGLSLLAIGAAPPFLQRLALSNPAGSRKILVTVFQRGAADGLNIVVPFGEPAYYRLRPSISVPSPKRGDASAAIDLDGFFGLHPALEPLKPLFDEKHFAIIHAVGSRDSTRSHFDAQDFMESGTPGIKSTTDGWLNRHLQTKADPTDSPFRALSMTANLPRMMRGPAPALAINNLNDFDLRTGGENNAFKSAFEAMYEQSVDAILGGTGTEAFEAIRLLKKANPTQYQPANGVQYPRGPFGGSLRQLAQMIKANVGVEIAFVESNGWDHHVGEGGVQGQLAIRLTELGQALAAFYRDLEGRMDDIVVLTMSEFGRTVRENGNRGTDHGHATSMFVLGGPVRGGKIYGQWPGLQPEQLFEGRDLALTTDFRSVFAEIISKHLGNSNLKTVFPNYTAKPEQFRNFVG